jgi:acyl carrier protein
VTSRLLHPMINDAARIVSEGTASVEAVDALMQGCLGHPTGPLRTGDLIGLDNLADSLNVLFERSGDERYRPCELPLEKVRAGDLGQKTGMASTITEGMAMTTEDKTLTAAAITEDVLHFVEAKTKSSVWPDADIFESGLVSSLFALELISHLEKSYLVSIDGEDIQLDNFRTVERMTGLVLRLKGLAVPDDVG